MKSKIKRKKGSIFLFPFLFILFVLLGVYFLYQNLFAFRKSIKKDISYFKSNASTLTDFYEKMFYKKFEKNEEDMLTKIDNWKVEKLNNQNYKIILEEKLQNFLNENSISQNDISLLVVKNDNEIVSINANQPRDVYDVSKLIQLIGLRNLYLENKINIDDTIKLEKSDFDDGSTHFAPSYVGEQVKVSNLINLMWTKKDNVSYRALERYVANNNLTIKSSLSDKINSIDFSNIQLIDTISIIEEYSKTDIRQGELFNITDENSQELFLNTIFTNIVSPNIYKDTELFKYDFGKVESDNEYFYSIYTENISNTIIQEIGDLVNRTIDEYETKLKIK